MMDHWLTRFSSLIVQHWLRRCPAFLLMLNTTDAWRHTRCYRARAPFSPPGKYGGSEPPTPELLNAFRQKIEGKFPHQPDAIMGPLTLRNERGGRLTLSPRTGSNDFAHGLTDLSACLRLAFVRGRRHPNVEPTPIRSPHVHSLARDDDISALRKVLMPLACLRPHLLYSHDQSGRASPLKHPRVNRTNEDPVGVSRPVPNVQYEAVWPPAPP